MKRLEAKRVQWKDEAYLIAIVLQSISSPLWWWCAADIASKERGKEEREKGREGERKEGKKKEGGKEEGRTKGSPPWGGYHWGGLSVPGPGTYILTHALVTYECLYSCGFTILHHLHRKRDWWLQALPTRTSSVTAHPHKHDGSLKDSPTAVADHDLGRGGEKGALNPGVQWMRWALTQSNRQVLPLALSPFCLLFWTMPFTSFAPTWYKPGLEVCLVTVHQLLQAYHPTRQYQRKLPLLKKHMFI